MFITYLPIFILENFSSAIFHFCHFFQEEMCIASLSPFSVNRNKYNIMQRIFKQKNIYEKRRNNPSYEVSDLRTYIYEYVVHFVYVDEYFCKF